VGRDEASGGTVHIRVVLVDDHPVWRHAIAGALEATKKFVVVGQAGDVDEALSVTASTTPDVVVMDVHLPGGSGGEATARILEQSPEVKVLVLSGSGAETDVLGALRAGARGYVLKTAPVDEVLDALHRIVRGEAVFSGDMAEILLRDVRSAPDAPPDAEPKRAVMTVMFYDLVDSTGMAGRLGDRSWLGLLQAIYADIEAEAAHADGRVVKTTGDGALLTFTEPARAVEAATRLVARAPQRDVQARAGLHTGECELLGNDIGGIAVHIASRVTDKAWSSEVLVSSTVRALLIGSDTAFRDRGSHALRGVPGRWRLFAVEHP
jgi:DNA-binding NarL/FixJ family response regulator